MCSRDVPSVHCGRRCLGGWRRRGHAAPWCTDGNERRSEAQRVPQRRLRQREPDGLVERGAIGCISARRLVRCRLMILMTGFLLFHRKKHGCPDRSETGAERHDKPGYALCRHEARRNEHASGEDAKNQEDERPPHPLRLPYPDHGRINSGVACDQAFACVRPKAAALQLSDFRPLERRRGEACPLIIEQAETQRLRCSRCQRRTAKRWKGKRSGGNLDLQGRWLGDLVKQAGTWEQLSRHISGQRWRR